MAIRTALLLWIVYLLQYVSTQTMKSGCTYDNTNGAIGLFSCDYTLVTFPISYSEFNNPRAQRLRIFKVNGDLKASGPKTFSGFNSMLTTDADYTAYLEIECSSGSTSGALIFSSGTFADMSYLQELYIHGCRFTAGIPANAFSNLVSLDILRIEGGSIASTTGSSLASFTIAKSTNLNKPKAILNITSVNLDQGSFASGFFYPLTDIETIILNNLAMTSLVTSEFSQNVKLQNLILRDNTFTTIPENMFADLKSLQSLCLTITGEYGSQSGDTFSSQSSGLATSFQWPMDVYCDLTGISFECTCANMWFIPMGITANITISENVACDDVPNNSTKNGAAYYYENCVTYDICSGIAGIIVDGYCYRYYEILYYIFLVVAFVIAVTATILVCYVRHVLLTERDKLNSKRNKAWSKIQDVLKNSVTGNQKPPAATGPPKKLKW